MSTTVTAKWIYDFAQGSRDMRELLGGKGSGIAEMTRVLGPDLVPPGFHHHHGGVRGVHACGPDRPRGTRRRHRRRARAPGGARRQGSGRSP